MFRLHVQCPYMPACMLFIALFLTCCLYRRCRSIVSNAARFHCLLPGAHLPVSCGAFCVCLCALYAGIFSVPCGCEALFPPQRCAIIFPQCRSNDCLPLPSSPTYPISCHMLFPAPGFLSISMAALMCSSGLEFPLSCLLLARFHIATAIPTLTRPPTP